MRPTRWQICAPAAWFASRPRLVLHARDEHDLKPPGPCPTSSRTNGADRLLRYVGADQADLRRTRLRARRRALGSRRPPRLEPARLPRGTRSARSRHSRRPHRPIDPRQRRRHARGCLRPAAHRRDRPTTRPPRRRPCRPTRPARLRRRPPRMRPAAARRRHSPRHVGQRAQRGRTRDRPAPRQRDCLSPTLDASRVPTSSVERRLRDDRNPEIGQAKRQAAWAVGGAERYYRRCDRAWVSRAFAASHIRSSSRSRAGLVGFEP